MEKRVVTSAMRFSSKYNIGKQNASSKTTHLFVPGFINDDRIRRVWLAIIVDCWNASRFLFDLETLCLYLFPEQKIRKWKSSLFLKYTLHINASKWVWWCNDQKKKRFSSECLHISVVNFAFKLWNWRKAEINRIIYPNSEIQAPKLINKSESLSSDQSV